VKIVLHLPLPSAEIPLKLKVAVDDNPKFGSVKFAKLKGPGTPGAICGVQTWPDAAGGGEVQVPTGSIPGEIKLIFRAPPGTSAASVGNVKNGFGPKGVFTGSAARVRFAIPSCEPFGIAENTLVLPTATLKVKKSAALPDASVFHVIFGPDTVIIPVPLNVQAVGPVNATQAL